MNKKEKFVQEVEDFLKENDTSPEDQFSQDALDYFKILRDGNSEGGSRFTENGLRILKCLQEEEETYSNLFKSKDIAEKLGVSSRTVSGSFRKLVTDGYVEKLGANPIIYSLTEKGRNIDLDEESA
jgi:DNA-binding MarR family transcriptional regulator